jgi:hypothetical protein
MEMQATQSKQAFMSPGCIVGKLELVQNSVGADGRDLSLQID